MDEITIRIPKKALKLAALMVGVIGVSAAVLYAWTAGVLVPRYQVRVFLPNTEGVHAGAPVTVDGVKVGNVSRLRLAKNQTNQSRSVEVVLRIEQRYQPIIRDDSTASVLTEGLLGNRYIDIQRGFAGTPIKPGGELRVTPIKELYWNDVIGDIRKAAGRQDGKKKTADDACPK